MPSLGVPASTAPQIALLALMFLNTRIADSAKVAPPPKSRQQRRYEERHPERTQVNVSYHMLKVNPAYMDDGEGTGKGGWTVAWHRVRGHLRHLKSGKVVQVRPHHKGNPLKGIAVKDYELKTPKLVGAA